MRSYDVLAMSLLQQDPNHVDDASLGEELTKGTSHIVIAAVIAAIVVTIAIAAYVIAGQKPPAATGEITRITAHPVHRETTGLDANGSPMPKEAFDQILVFTHVKLHNQSDKPLFFRSITANVTLPDGIHSAYAASPVDYDRLFQAYPDLASFRAASIPSEPTIEPGKTLEGDFVAAFRMTKQDWDARKGLDYTASIKYQPDLKLTPTVSIETR